VTRRAVEIPKVGLVMENARLVRWLKNVGDSVKAGEPLLELETEKSIVEIEATMSGWLLEILVHPDQEAKVGDRVAWVETDEPESTVTSAPASQTSAPKSAPPRPARADVQFNQRIRSTPVARRRAAEHNVDIGRITGSGPLGRVQLEDVEHAIGAAQNSSTGNRGEGALAPMRRALARAMTLSNATVPQFNVGRAIDMSSLQSLRAELSAKIAKDSPKLSVNDFLLQGVARTLLEMPALNATFSGDPSSPDARIVPAKGVHIGLVVALDDGLLVPVIHHVEQLGLAQLAARRAELVERARHGHLKREELEGATFSLSNLGADGPDHFTALINPPQSAILAVGRQRECVVARNGGVEVRPTCELTLTVDHRVADGRLAAKFLARLVEILEGRDWRVNS
jgi:pyruvate dehydrogenase E2 component (dihydrolipoyllysine-residue acetyltransferase)